jgi:FMN reductase
MPMKQPTLVALGGTHREHSLSRAALQHTLDLAQSLGAAVELLDLGKLELPMYRADSALADYAPADRAALEHFAATCRRADAMLWASPTYHGTLSGLFKNALDHFEWLSEDERPYLVGRAIGLISINDSKTFSAMSNAVHELRGWLAPTHIVLDKRAFDAELRLTDPTAQRRIERLTRELLSFTLRS